MNGVGGPGATDQGSGFGGMSPALMNMMGLAMMIASKGPVGSTPPGAAIGSQLVSEGNREAGENKRLKVQQDEQAERRADQQQKDAFEAYRLASTNADYTADPQAGGNPLVQGMTFGGMALPPLYGAKKPTLPPALSTDPQYAGMSLKDALALYKFNEDLKTGQESTQRNQAMSQDILGQSQPGKPNRQFEWQEPMATPPRLDPVVAEYLSKKVLSGKELSDKEIGMLFPPKISQPPTLGANEAKASWKDAEGVTHTIESPKPDKEKVSDIREEVAGLLGFNLAKGLNAQGQPLTAKDRQDWTNKVNELERTRRAPIETPESRLNQDEKIGKIVDQREDRDDKRYKPLNVNPPDKSIYYALQANPEEYRAKYHAEKPDAAEMESMREERYREIKDKIVGAGVPTSEQRTMIDKVMTLDGWPKRKAPDASKVDTQKLTDFRDQWQSDHPPEKFVGKEIDVPGMPGVILRCDGTKWFPVVRGNPQGQK